jgi:superfamily II DNA or RNA helicase
LTNLLDLHLRGAYHKGEDDIARDFYLPAVAASVEYRRAVGFFSSSIFVLAWPSLRQFVESGGHIWLLCAPVLSDGDVEALIQGHSDGPERLVRENLVAEIQTLLDDPLMSKPARVLASLVAHDIMEVRLAFLGAAAPPQGRRIFHDKLGLLRDASGNTLAFKGSMNETYNGLAPDGNLESIDVFVDWGDEREAERVQDESEYFANLWEGKYPGVITLPFPEVAREQLIRASEGAWQTLVDEICDEIEGGSPGDLPTRIRLREHQTDALESWEAAGRRGILEHATGSGKTVTALTAARAAMQRGEVPLIIVPSELLLQQWTREIKGFLDDVKPGLLVCGGGETRWRAERRLPVWSAPGTTPRVILAMMQTACTADFIRDIRSGEHLFIIADEVHRLGSRQAREILTIDSGPRLGLSATPTRAGDEAGTRAILDYFGGIIDPPFTLANAVAARILTPYMYFVHAVTLLDEEQLEWNRLTRRIGQALAIQAHGSGSDDSYLQNLLIQRARVVKQAAEKVPLSVRVVADNFRAGQKWLVYCDSQAQMNDVAYALRAAGVDATEYHSDMTADKQQTLRHFDVNGGVIVAIKCLDEGVDIPSVSHALILASSKNPREFIQRRGRVLRKAPGKGLAYIHDAIVIPRSDGINDPVPSLLEGELARAIQFGLDAANPAVIEDLRAIALRFGIDVEKFVHEGYEDGD